MAVKKEVTFEAIEKAKKTLLALPEKEPAKKFLDDALLELKPQIEAALERGYSKTEIIDVLAKQGVPVKQFHLKNLLAVKRGVPEVTETQAT